MLQVYKGGTYRNPQTTMNTDRAARETRTTLRSITLAASLMAAALLLLFCSRDATAGRSGEAAGRPLEPVIAKVLNAWDRADAQAIAAQYEDGGDFVSPDGMHAKGRREIETFYQGAFARGYAATHATATIVHVRHLSGTVAFVDGIWTIEPTPASKVRRPEAGLFFAVLHRSGAYWQIAALREQSSATAMRELGAP